MLINNINKFIKSNLWRRTPSVFSQYEAPIDVYCRLTTRLIDGEFRHTLDIARIAVDEGEEGKGRAGQFFDQVERLAQRHGLVLFVESIMNPNLAGMLERRGYKISGEELAPNAHKDMSDMSSDLQP